METFSALLIICAGNSLVSGEFPAQRPVTQSFDVFLDLRLNKRLSKQSQGWWFETLSCHYDVIVMVDHATAHSWPTTAPGDKLLSIPILSLSFSNRTSKSHNVHLLWNRIIMISIDITGFKSTHSPSVSTLPRIRDDVTMSDECKQSIPSPNMHVNKNFQMNIFHKFESLHSTIWWCVRSKYHLRYVSQIYKVKYEHSIKRISMEFYAIFSKFIRGLRANNAWLWNDDVTTIEFSYWLRREFSKLCTAASWYHRISWCLPIPSWWLHWS